ncbi:FAD-dependent oxidoreductase [Pantanalinema sp. GBBB05]|uniref:FAD-dependent oxidoreductase n=1 Tax=Pantanalinema sp. GBBB05 TaxID=2604139 RepID=UPI003D819F58
MKRRTPPRRKASRRRLFLVLIGLYIVSFTAGHILGTLLAGAQQQPVNALGAKDTTTKSAGTGQAIASLPPITRPQLSPLPKAKEVWDCEVVVVGGSLGGVAAAAHAMQSGAKTCLIELSPWLGGQISAQGVSAIDESETMQAEQNFSKSWMTFKQLIAEQEIKLPAWESLPPKQRMADLNSCWVSGLCFLPEAGALASDRLLQSAARHAAGSRWATQTAFKGAEFDATGHDITAIYAVQRTPRQPNYMPEGRLSKEIATWYAWSSDATFEKTPLRLQAPPGKRLIVIDATDTGELIGWANIPYRLGAESQATSGEIHAPKRDNPSCTQAFTFPFVLAIRDDQGASKAALAKVKSDYAVTEHEQEYDLEGFPMFAGHSLFHYRRILSTTRNDPSDKGVPSAGDMTVINWNRGNDWGWMDPPLLLTDDQLDISGQRQNWLGGMSVVALRHAENHALLFARWLLNRYPKPELPLSYLSGADSPMRTASGLSMIPYFREGRRIVGRPAYGQRRFAVRENDIRTDMEGGRDFSQTAIALAHYDIDIHGCRYRNWGPSWEATGAPADEAKVRPIHIPIESLVPQGVNNMLVGGKAIAVTHITNAATRVHYGEWSVGSAAGATAAWLLKQNPATTTPADIVPQGKITALRRHLVSQGLRLDW